MFHGVEVGIRLNDEDFNPVSLSWHALAFSLALPFNENAEKSINNEMNEIANEFQAEQREG